MRKSARRDLVSDEETPAVLRGRKATLRGCKRRLGDLNDALGTSVVGEIVVLFDSKEAQREQKELVELEGRLSRSGNEREASVIALNSQRIKIRARFFIKP